jgi:hypothetical protein
VLEIHQRRSAEMLSTHLDTMASSISPVTTSDEMEAALEEALAHVRPQRSWQM